MYVDGASVVKEILADEVLGHQGMSAGRGPVLHGHAATSRMWPH
jgi:hypothetical protein